MSLISIHIFIRWAELRDRRGQYDQSYLIRFPLSPQKLQ